MKSKEKAQFKRKASDNNGTIRVNLPKQIRQHLNLEEGEQIAFQTEHNEEHGPYASFWNPKQQGEQKNDD